MPTHRGYERGNNKISCAWECERRLNEAKITEEVTFELSIDRQAELNNSLCQEVRQRGRK
jgi:hypothetical protein